VALHLPVRAAWARRLQQVLVAGGGRLAAAGARAGLGGGATLIRCSPSSLDRLKSMRPWPR
jgi:siroheme synthase (precorrin-2 oxidase/ferrochelatase)